MTLFNDLGDSLICCRAIVFCASLKVHGPPLPGRSTNPTMPWVSYLKNQVETVCRQTLYMEQITGTE